MYCIVSKSFCSTFARFAFCPSHAAMLTSAVRSCRAAASVARRGMSTFKSPFAIDAYPDMPLTEFILERAHEFGDKEAFVDGPTGRTIKYNELAHRIGGAAEALGRMGFNEGDVLNIHLPNTPEYGIAFNAAAALGGVVTTSNPMYTAEELHHQLKDSKAKIVLTAAPFKELAEKAVQGTSVERIVLAGTPDDFSFAPGVQFAGTPAAVAADTKKATAVMPYSSGTTGAPQGTMLSHSNLTSNVAQISMHPEFNLGMKQDDRVIAVLPFQHIYGMVVVMMAPLRTGATIVTLPKFDPQEFLTTMDQHKISWAPLVPPIILFLAKHPIVDKFDLSSLNTIFSGAAPLDSETQAAASRRLDCKVLQGYGMTELSPVSHMSHPTKHTAGSVGLLVPGCEARIVDVHSGKDLPAGREHEGELWVKGPNVMQGYLGQPAATAATVTPDGWLKTGDLVSADEEGRFFVVDRLKELIKCKGFQVAPAELEGLLFEQPSIADCAVIPLPHERHGEVPKAFVVRADTPEGAALTEEDVKAALAPHVADYKHLHAVEFVDAIPKSAAGKILRRVLRAGEAEKSAAAQ